MSPTTDHKPSFSVHNKQLGSFRSMGAMGFGIVRNLIAHTRLKNKFPAISELKMQLTFQAQQNVPFRAPVISKIPGRIFNQPNPNIREVPRPPISGTGLALVLCPLNSRPVSGLEWELTHLHA
jgi:hypothetical protein